MFFGPFSSLFDFITFGVMLWVFSAGPELFRTGWFVESLATQTLVIFAIRTRRIPFFRSHPSVALALAVVAVVIVSAMLPATPLAGVLGFVPLPFGFFAVLALMVVGYLVLVEVGKSVFYRMAVTGTHATVAREMRTDRPLRRRMRRFSTDNRLASPKRPEWQRTRTRKVTHSKCLSGDVACGRTGEVLTTKKEDRMKALVVFESMFGNTDRVAEAIAEGLRQSFEVTVQQAARQSGALGAGGPRCGWGTHSRSRTAHERFATGCGSAGRRSRSWSRS